MLKSCLWRLLASVFAVVCVSTAFAVDETYKPSVTVSPGAQTVKVSPNGAAETEYNTAKYTVKGFFDENSITNAEIKPVYAVWTCSASAKFIPPEGVMPVPQNPDNPTIPPLTGSNGSWEAKVYSPNAGQWEITFTATVTYDVWDKKTGKVRVKEDRTNEKFGPYTGSGKCLFAATQKPFKVEISVAPVICRHSTNPPKRPVKEVTATLVDADEAKTILFTRQGGGLVCFGESADNAISDSITKPIPKDGEVKFWVSGEVESQAMNDAIINANSTDTNPEIVGSAATTVLWVVVSVRGQGSIAIDNSAKDYFSQYAFDPNQGNLLGGRFSKRYDGDTKRRYGHAFEVAGVVVPTDFIQNVVITRDVVDMWTEKPIFATEGLMYIQNKTAFSLNDGANDQSEPPVMDTTPPIIYDLDAPSVNYTLHQNRQDTDYLRAFNAKQWAIFENIRCSDVISFSVLYAMRFRNGSEITCVSVLVPDVFCDIKINPGDESNEFQPR